MEVDESFAGYVAARWSMLFRLAVLLAGEDAADDLAQAGLVQAYLSWRDVQEAASVDDAVKRIVATTAVRRKPDPQDEQPASGSSRDRLWATITALPPRQRAVLVLRHYEGLYDPEIAGIVHSSPSAVTAEAGALEAGIDLVELRDELVQRAEDAIVPLPPVRELLVQGRLARRRRRRRTATRLGLAAALVACGVAIAAAIQAITPDSPRAGRAAAATDLPRFLSSLPHGALPKSAYSVRRFLYLPGGRGVDLAERPAAIAQTPHWVYVAFLSGKIVRIDTDTLAVERVLDTSGGQLVTDSRGSGVAWLSSRRGKAVVFLTSLEGGETTDTRLQEFPATLRCCDDPFRVNGITGAGELIASLPAENRAWVWDTHATGDAVQEISGIGNGLISEVTVRGLVVQYPPSQYAVGRLENGAFLQVAELVAREADFSDPLGLRVVFTDDNGEVDVRDLAARGRSRRAPALIRLKLPLLDNGFSGVHWEDDDHVILDVFDESAPDGALVRCDVRDGSCELADELEGPHILSSGR